MGFWNLYIIHENARLNYSKMPEPEIGITSDLRPRGITYMIGIERNESYCPPVWITYSPWLSGWNRVASPPGSGWPM